MGRVGSTNERITQMVAGLAASYSYSSSCRWSGWRDKRNLLLDLMTASGLATKNFDCEANRTLVFVETKRDADILDQYL